MAFGIIWNILSRWKKILDIYSDFLFANSSQATATSFSDALDGRISHDKFSRFLREDVYTSMTLWGNIKTDIRIADDDEKAILSFDDSIVDKTPYKRKCYQLLALFAC